MTEYETGYNGNLLQSSTRISRWVKYFRTEKICQANSAAQKDGN